ncbi:MAG: right-handed parallel beta-helix repeat-containing protein [Chthoniobacteraceae bacterium]
MKPHGNSPLTPRRTLAALLLGICFSTFIAIAPAQATIYYVSVSGSDTYSGTSTGAAFATIQKGLSTAQAGDIVTVETGTYRQTATAAFVRSGSASAPITLQAAANAQVTVQGSTLVTGFVLSSGSTYVKSPWNTYFSPNDPGQTDARGKPRDQLFVNGAYYPEATGTSAMTAGSFYDDNVNKKLYVWLANGGNPNSYQVDATTVGGALLNTASYNNLVVNGIEFQYCANEPQTGMFIVGGTNNIVKNCTCQYAAGAGFGLEYGQYDQVIDCQFNHNTQEGFHSTHCTNVTMYGCETSYNNTEPDKVYDSGWEAGGFKISWSNGFDLWDHTSMHNNSNGIWFDVSNQNALIEDCYSSFNGEGIYYEISYTGTMINNICAYNTDSGFNVSSSAGCYLANNLAYGNSAYGITEIDPSGTNALRTDGSGNPVYCYANQYYNNIVAYNQTISNKKSYVVSSGTTPRSGFSGNPILSFSPDQSDYNEFYINHSAAFFIDHTTGYEPSTLPSWQSESHFDAHSIWADPLLVAPSSSNYQLTGPSPAIGSGTTLADVPVDIMGASCPQLWAVISGAGVDITGTSDQFNYAWQNFSGDGSIIALVDYQAKTTGHAKSGVMFRSGTAATSPHALMCFDAGGSVSFIWRSVTSGTTGSVQINGFVAPIWMKVTRSGSNFSGYYSTDGTTWNQAGSTVTISGSSMPTAALAGLAVCSNTPSAVSSARFTDTSIGGGQFVPVLLTDTDIGSPALSGTAIYGSGICMGPYEYMPSSYIYVPAANCALTGQCEIALSSTCSTGAYVTTPSTAVLSSSDSITVPFTTATSGTYNVWFRGMGATTQTNSYNYSFNGGTQNTIKLSTPTWGWVSVSGTTLPKGANVLMLYGRQPASNMDRILITNDLIFEPTEMSGDN